MANPLLDVNCIRKPGCEYPMQIRVAMDDGSVQTYNLEVKQPIENPSFREAMDALDRMMEIVENGFGCSKERKYRRN